MMDDKCVGCAAVTEALSACHYIPEVRSNVFNILYHALNSENAELQQASHQCMKRVSMLLFASFHQLLASVVVTCTIWSLQSTLGDRAFPAARAWNALSSSVCSAPSLL